MINLIRSSKTPDDAKEGLMTRFGLSDIQSKAILEMRLQRLTGLERDKIRAEYEEVMALTSVWKRSWPMKDCAIRSLWMRPWR